MNTEMHISGCRLSSLGLSASIRRLQVIADFEQRLER